MADHAHTDETTRKLPIWHALSELFVDTELQHNDYVRIARALTASGLPAEELRRILGDEVGPAFVSNLMSVAGEWAPWSEDEVLRIMTRPTGRPTRWLWRWAARRTVTAKWEKLRPLIEA